MERFKEENVDWKIIEQLAKQKNMSLRNLSMRMGNDPSYLGNMRHTQSWIWSNKLELIAEMIGAKYDDLLKRQVKYDQPCNTDENFKTYIVEQFGRTQSMLLTLKKQLDDVERTIHEQQK